MVCYADQANFSVRLESERMAQVKSESTRPDAAKADGVSHLIILGHPSPASFNAAIARQYVETARANHQEAVVRDLYDLGFDPLLKESERLPAKEQPFEPDVERELDLIRKCDVVTFIYPLWFGTPPAIVKGYVDRVFGAGFRVTDLKTGRNELFSGKKLVVLTTSASTLPWLEAQGMWVSLRQSFEHYLKAVFGFSKNYHYHADSIVDDLDRADAERILFEVDAFARTVCAETAMALRLE